MGTQWQSGVRTNQDNPLLHGGRELVPNITHVVSPEQHLYFYYEVYDPTAVASASANQSTRPVHLLTSVAFFRGRVRAFETPPIEVTALSGNDGKKAVFQFDVPASSLTPGVYTCQVNVVDDASGTYVFPRFQLYVRR